MPRKYPERIVSGGQTGVDRGALDAAIALGFAHGGWCPRGRLAEDGVIPARYQLHETDSPRYSARTRQNVIDSSGTLILCWGPMQGGTDLTYRLAQQCQKPCRVVDLSVDVNAAEVRRWIQDHQLRVLNVAGPRESSTPGIAAQTQRFLIELLEGTGPMRRAE
ncbi:MAG: putative molybdenum carrier protein [Planctomycetota bacterium]